MSEESNLLAVYGAEESAMLEKSKKHPANEHFLGLREIHRRQPVWQVVRRPLSEDEKKKRAEEKAKKTADKAPNSAEEQDEEVYVEERFHYYWRLSAPEPYRRAGAVGRHWRAIRVGLRSRRLVADTLLNFKEKGSLCWIKEDRWQRLSKTKSKSDMNIEIFDSSFESMRLFVKDIEIMTTPSTKEKITFKDFDELVEACNKDPSLATEAQTAATGKDLMAANMQSIHQNHDLFPFQYTSGTFVNSNGSIAETPTIDERAGVDRLYVKLRQSQSQFSVAGGLDASNIVDVFILKTTIDKLSGIEYEDDPPRASLHTNVENAQWGPDERGTGKNDGQKTGQASKTRTGRLEKTIWVRNAQGFAFQWTFITSADPRDSWNKRRKDAISLVEQGGGWIRYIDPKIELYIVPTSSTEPICDQVVQTMKNLSMDKQSLTISTSIMDEDETKRVLSKLRKVSTVNCATEKVHLLLRSDFKDKKLRKLALSPFGHYETWIKESDWKSYQEARPARSVPGYTKQEDRDYIDKAKLLVSQNAGDTEAFTPLRILVWPEKITQAKGSRTTAKKQADVMGCSATEIAQALGWEAYNSKIKEANGWPSTSYMPAEWLHRCAYSWGGLKNNPTTSQVPKNLIFGTSECNSVMMRHEKAWQALVVKEGKRLRSSEAYDSEDDEPAALRSGGNGGGILCANIERRGYRADFGPEDPDKDPVPQLMTEQEQHEHLPHWLCYALDYRLEQTNKVEPLGSKTTFGTVFYPFQRGFYTKFEQALDEVILDSAYNSYEANLKAFSTQPIVTTDVTSGTASGGDVVMREDEKNDGPKKGEKMDEEFVNKDNNNSLKPESGEVVDMVDEGGSENRNLPLKFFLNRDQTRLLSLQGPKGQQDDARFSHSHRLVKPALASPGDAPDSGAVWKQVHAPGPTLIDGLVLTDAAIVVGGDNGSYSMQAGGFHAAAQSEPNTTSTTQPAQKLTKLVQEYSMSTTALTKADQEPAGHPKAPGSSPVPERFVVKSTFKLFGKHQTEIFMLQDAARPRVQYYRVRLPHELSLGAFMPTLAGSDLDAIAMRDTKLEYRSHGRVAGLSFSTEITLSGLLQPVNALLRDIFKQDRPRINVSAHLGMVPPKLWFAQAPAPLGFTLRGELPDVNVPDLFGVLTVTHIGLDVVGTRRGSAGGYDLGYGFFGRGRVNATTAVQWRISKFGEYWRIAINVSSGGWKNVAGINGVDLTDVFMEAAWMGTKLSTMRLDLRATFSIKEQATLMLEGKLGKNDFEVTGHITNCSLTTLKELYNQTFGGDIDVTTDHDIVLSSLVLTISKSTTSQITLYGAVSVDGHEAAKAVIKISVGCIVFEGQLDQGFSVGTVKILEPALAVNIHTGKSETGRGFEVQFSGKVSVAEKHHFDAAVHLSKTGEGVEYTVYGAYDGDFYLHDLMSILNETDLLRNVRMRELAVCVSNAKDPGAVIKSRPPGYDIKQGLTVYAEVDLPVLKNVLGLNQSTPFLVRAAFTPTSKGSSVKIAILVPDANAFTIQGFSVGNISLEVAVVDAQPTIAIGGDLSFPVENGKHLTLELDLSAGIYEARGEAQLNTPWVNPFDLNDALVVHNFKAGLGILYAGTVPSSVILGGAVAIGHVAGTLLVHTGADPSKQLLHVKIVNLDVAQLLNTVGSLVKVDLGLPTGSDAFFIRKLEIYLSTGVDLFGVQYKQGISIDADMTVFGKRALLHAELGKNHAVFKGSVERFKVGALEVCAASGADKDPYIEMELSQSVRRIKVDGKVLFGRDNWLIILIDIDTGAGSFNVYFEFVVGDALKIIVSATLEGGLPQAKQDRLEQFSDGQGGSIWQPQHESNPVGDGGLLHGKTLTVHAQVEQHIIEYLMKLANDHLGGERRGGEERTLRDALNTAEGDLKQAEIRCGKVKAGYEVLIDQITKGLDGRLNEIKGQRSAEQQLKETKMSEMDHEGGDIVLMAAYNERELAKITQSEAAIAEEAAREANVKVELFRGRLRVLEVAELEVQSALNALDVVEAQAARAQMAVIQHRLARPEEGRDDAAYEPWCWTDQQLAKKVEVHEAKVRTAKADVKVAQDAVLQLEMGSLEETTVVLNELTAKMEDAGEIARERRAAVEIKLKAARAKAEEDRAAHKKRRSEQIAHSDKMMQHLAHKEAELERERSDALAAARAKYDVNNTDEGSKYTACLGAQRAADAKLKSYLELKNSVSEAEQILLAPLRFTVNVLGTVAQKILNITSITIDGQLTDNSGHVSAQVACTVGGFDYNFTLSIELGNIVSFFSALWEKIKGVISSVANELLSLVREGTKAIRDFANKIGDEVMKVVDCTLNHFMEELAAHKSEVEGFLKDIDNALIDPFKKLGDRMTHVLEGAAQDVANQFDKMEHDLEGTFRKDPRDIIYNFGNEAFKSFDDIGLLPKGISWFPSGQNVVEVHRMNKIDVGGILIQVEKVMSKERERLEGETGGSKVFQHKIEAMWQEVNKERELLKRLHDCGRITTKELEKRYEEIESCCQDTQAGLEIAELLRRIQVQGKVADFVKSLGAEPFGGIDAGARDRLQVLPTRLDADKGKLQGQLRTAEFRRDLTRKKRELKRAEKRGDFGGKQRDVLEVEVLELEMKMDQSETQWHLEVCEVLFKASIQEGISEEEKTRRISDIEKLQKEWDVSQVKWERDRAILDRAQRKRRGE